MPYEIEIMQCFIKHYIYRPHFRSRADNSRSRRYYTCMKFRMQVRKLAESVKLLSTNTNQPEDIRTTIHPNVNIHDLLTSNWAYTYV